MQQKREEIQRQALESALFNHRNTLCISMRMGKTYIGLQYLNKKYSGPESKFLVAAPVTTIFQSWIDDAIKFGLEHLIPCIRFSTYLSLNKQDPDYDVLILDEVHSVKFGHSSWLDQYKGPILGLTGTKPTHQLSEKYQMLAKYCPVTFEYTTDEAVDDGILNDYRIYVHTMNLSHEKIVKVATRTGGYFMQSEVDKYDYYAADFNAAHDDLDKGYAMLKMLYQQEPADLQGRLAKSEKIASQKAYLNQVKEKMKTSALFLGRALMTMPTKERYTLRLLQTIREKCIVFANTRDQADRLCRYSYHSGNKDSKENLNLFREGEISRLSCINQLSEGAGLFRMP